MQRRSGSGAGRNKYVKSGVAGHDAPGGKKPSALPKILRPVFGVGVVLLAALVVIFLIGKVFPQTAQIVRLEARVTDNIQAFGDSVLYYDGTTLVCVGSNGKSKWTYTIGGGADFSTDGTRIVLWSGAQLHVLDARGNATFIDKLDNTIRMARVGGTYVAACIGDSTTASVRVLSHTGSLLETIDFSGLYPLDIGFFSNQGQRMWVLGLDLGSNAPITKLSTYEPGRMATGAVEFNDELAYRVYPYNNLLMVADTSKIRAYNYKCVEQTSPAAITIYGWEVRQVRTVGRDTHALLRPMLSMAGGLFSSLRLVTNASQTAQPIRLLTPCFAGGLSEKGVYAIGSSVVYYLPYGEKVLRTTHLTYTLTDFICMLDGGSAVVVAGQDVLILKLPTK